MTDKTTTETRPVLTYLVTIDRGCPQSESFADSYHELHCEWGIWNDGEEPEVVVLTFPERSHRAVVANLEEDDSVLAYRDAPEVTD